MMKAQKKYPILLSLGAVAIIFLLSACNVVTSGSTSSNLSAQQVLQKSATAMKNLKSSHFAINLSDNAQTTGTSSATGATPTSTGTIALTLKGSGDQALPDQQKANLTISSASFSSNLAEIQQGTKVYIQGNDQKWYVIDASQLKTANVTLPQVNLDQSSLLGLIQDVRLGDHGDETLNGQSLRHLSAQLDKTALEDLINNDPQLKSQFSSININQVLNNTKSFSSSVDVWIDETNFYIHRSQLQINFDANTGALNQKLPSEISEKLNTTIDLSNFNETVSITPPANATPITSESQLTSLGAK